MKKFDNFLELDGELNSSVKFLLKIVQGKCFIFKTDKKLT